MEVPVCIRSGVYKILNTVTGKVYVGSACNGFKQRAASHLNELNRGVHANRHLQRSWDKHGGDIFKFVLLQVCNPRDCLVTEQKWIDRLSSADSRYGYNICPNAGSRLGTTQSDASNAKNAASHRGKKLSRDTRIKMSISQRAKAGPEKSKAMRRAVLIRWNRIYRNPSIKG